MSGLNGIPPVRIGTHSGLFHCDEALACFMLQQLPNIGSNCEVIRTRDETILATCDYVVDVGGVYDPEWNRYDHHQREFQHTFGSLRPDIDRLKCTRLSSAGLVYVHFGEEVISEIFKAANILMSQEGLKTIYKHVYKTFIEEIDAIDNGVPMFEGEPKYSINTHLSARVGRLNPEWNSPESCDTDALFRKAVELVGKEFVEKVVDTGTIWWPARDIVKQAVEKRFEIHESGKIIELSTSCPWKEHLFTIEEESGLGDTIKFVIFTDKSQSWRVQAIPVQPNSFICRLFLKNEWHGVRDELLCKVSGIPECIFCHATGFIGGNCTRKGAIQMAIESLKCEK